MQIWRILPKFFSSSYHFPLSINSFPVLLLVLHNFFLVRFLQFYLIPSLLHLFSVSRTVSLLSWKDQLLFASIVCKQIRIKEDSWGDFLEEITREKMYGSNWECFSSFLDPTLPIPLKWMHFNQWVSIFFQKFFSKHCIWFMVSYIVPLQFLPSSFVFYFLLLWASIQ